MKIGPRTPSIKKRVTAKTKSQLTRKAKSAINPLYGKKGMGYINDPKRAVKNAIYNKTTQRVGKNSSGGGCAIAGVVLVAAVFLFLIGIAWWLYKAIFS